MVAVRFKAYIKVIGLNNRQACIPVQSTPSVPQRASVRRLQRGIMLCQTRGHTGFDVIQNLIDLRLYIDVIQNLIDLYNLRQAVIQAVILRCTTSDRSLYDIEGVYSEAPGSETAPWSVVATVYAAVSNSQTVRQDRCRVGVGVHQSHIGLEHNSIRQ